MGGQKWACPFCNKIWKTPSVCKRHIRSHTGEKPYKCTHCEKMFNKVTNLQRHRYFHHTDNSKSYIKRRQKTTKEEPRLKSENSNFSSTDSTLGKKKEQILRRVYDLPVRRELKIEKSNPSLSLPDSKKNAAHFGHHLLVKTKAEKKYFVKVEKLKIGQDLPIRRERNIQQSNPSLSPPDSKNNVAHFVHQPIVKTKAEKKYFYKVKKLKIDLRVNDNCFNINIDDGGQDEIFGTEWNNYQKPNTTKTILNQTPDQIQDKSIVENRQVFERELKDFCSNPVGKLYIFSGAAVQNDFDDESQNEIQEIVEKAKSVKDYFFTALNTGFSCNVCNLYFVDPDEMMSHLGTIHKL